MTQQNTAAVLPFAQPKKPMDFGAALAATKTTETKAKKGKAPVLDDAPAEVKAAVDQYMEGDALEKQGAGIKEVARPLIEGFVRGHQDKDGYAGRYNKSYAVLGNTQTAKVGYANKFTLSPNDEAELQNILGDNYGAMISRKPIVTLKAEVFESEELQAALMEAIGARFPDFFETKMSLSVCDDFDKLVYQVLDADALAQLRVFAKQYKPTIR